MIDVKRLKCNRNNERGDSLSVMIHFDDDKLPSKVFLGFMSFSVRPYVPPPLRCYKCQKCGHVAAVCRGKQRCARCGGEHEYGKCGQEVNPKCCNCGGDHSAGYGGCKVRKHAAQVQNVRIQEGLTYSEALKKVGKNLESGEKSKEIIQQKTEMAKEKTKEKFGIKNNVAFVTFMAEVVNCSAQTESRTERIRIIIKAAEKYLEIEGISVDMINVKLKMQTTYTQPGWWYIMVLLIFQWNARSLIANGQEFKKLISDLENKPDIICVQETWLKPQLNFVLQGYVVIPKDRKQGNGGGVATFIKQGVGYRNVEESVDKEVVVMEVWEGSHSIKVINFYNPCEKLSKEVLESIRGNTNQKVIWCADCGRNVRLGTVSMY